MSPSNKASFMTAILLFDSKNHMNGSIFPAKRFGENGGWRMVDKGLETIKACHFFGNGVSPFGITVELVE